jgi:hypothetical protein
MEDHAMVTRSKFRLGSLALLSFPLVSWGFFPPFDLYPQPPIRTPNIEQPIPPVPEPPNPPVVLPPVLPPPIIEQTPPQVPEPTTLVLALVGLGGMLCLRNRRKPEESETRDR